MEKSRIETLLEAANSSPDNDSSINFAKRVFLDEDAARAFYASVAERMIQIEEWGSSSSVSDYDLFDAAGRQINGERIDVGTFIRIRLYATGKYDWVCVDDILDAPLERVITVRPAFDPTKPDQRDRISHFFRQEARNNFCLQLNEKSVAFYVIGLHEKQNTEFTETLVEAARNAAVANLGYYSGVQKAVWKEFCSSMLEAD